jgi:hypothetical protein
MRYTFLIGCIALIAGCTAKGDKASDSNAVDTTAAAKEMSPYIAGIWNVEVRPEGKDSVATTYLLNTTDPETWLFAFPNGKPIQMKVTGLKGDTVLSETDWFDSSVRPGLKARSSARTWMLDTMLVGKILVHYQTSGPDTTRLFDTRATRKRD